MLQSKDLFSSIAANYSRYRPHYPQALYDFIYNRCTGFEKSWDCGTGNGQVANQLALKFKEVYATDLSKEQLKYATKLENIQYNCESGEDCSATDRSFDLVTVAQAVHWFDFEKFYQQVYRVLKPEGIIAIWVYENIKVDVKVDELILYLYKDVLGPYWAPERKYIEEKLQTIPFPFSNQIAGEFRMEVEWNNEHLLGYLNSWSAWAAFYKNNPQEKLNQNSTILQFRKDLRSCWPDGERKKVWFPLFLRMGTI